MRTIRLLSVLALFSVASGVALASAARPAVASAFVYRIEVDGPISPAIADYIRTSIARTREDGAAALVIALDTPGGLLNSTKTIVKDLLASAVPVIVYVSPAGASATSAGVFITLAAHIAAMAPGTTIGAAHPVSGQGGDIEGDMRKKVENFAVSFVESIAEHRGRNVEWAAQAVRESVSITETEAAEKHVVDFVASDVVEVLRKANGLEVDVAGAKRVLDFSRVVDENGRANILELEMTLRQRVLRIITDPNIAYLLMMAGMLGLYFEFSNPGTIFPGVVGAICLLLALLAAQVLPISSTGILLILLGMAFLIAELLMPSFGILGFGGIVALTLGSLFLYTPESQMEVDRSLVAATVAVFAAALGAILLLLVGDRRKQPVTGAEGLVGEIGVALTPIHKDGRVKVHGEFWNAYSDKPIAAGTSVEVVEVSGLRVRVRPRED